MSQTDSRTQPNITLTSPTSPSHPHHHPHIPNITLTSPPSPSHPQHHPHTLTHPSTVILKLLLLLLLTKLAMNVPHQYLSLPSSLFPSNNTSSLHHSLPSFTHQTTVLPSLHLHHKSPTHTHPRSHTHPHTVVIISPFTLKHLCRFPSHLPTPYSVSRMKSIYLVRALKNTRERERERERESVKDRWRD